MNRLALTLILSCLVCLSYGQGYIDGYKRPIRKEMEKYGSKEHLGSHVVETDSTIHLIVRDSAYWAFDMVFHFNHRGRCDSETRITPCDSCFHKYLNEALTNKKYAWTKENDSTYISRPSKNRVLQIISDPGGQGDQPHQYAYVIARSH